MCLALAVHSHAYPISSWQSALPESLACNSNIEICGQIWTRPGALHSTEAPRVHASASNVAATWSITWQVDSTCVSYRRRTSDTECLTQDYMESVAVLDLGSCTLKAGIPFNFPSDGEPSVVSATEHFLYRNFCRCMPFRIQAADVAFYRGSLQCWV